MYNGKAGIYIRTNEKLLADKHIEMLKEVCRTKGINIYKIYTDIGLSGTTSDRPGLQKMLEDAKGKKFDFLIIMTLSVLSRTLKLYREIGDILSSNNISILELKNQELVPVEISNAYEIQMLTETFISFEEQHRGMEKDSEEVTEDFLNYIRGQIEYWDNIEGKSTKEKLSGLAHSILLMLDGESDLPAFIVAPLADDIEHRIQNNEKYYPDNSYAEVDCDISGNLHKLFIEEESDSNGK